MFEKDSNKEIEDRLLILHFLTVYKKNISDELLINFFIESKYFTYLDITNLLDKLVKARLIYIKNNTITITENGIVAHSFFIDMLKIKMQQSIELMIQNSELLNPKISHQISYDSRNEVLYLLVANGKDIITDLKISITKNEIAQIHDDKKIIGKEIYEKIKDLIIK